MVGGIVHGVLDYSAVFLSLLAKWFGCRHKDFSFPQTPRRGERKKAAAMITGTYVVCLTCGQEFAYSWKEMKVLENPDLSGR